MDTPWNLLIHSATTYPADKFEDGMHSNVRAYNTPLTENIPCRVGQNTGSRNNRMGDFRGVRETLMIYPPGYDIRMGYKVTVAGIVDDKNKLIKWVVRTPPTNQDGMNILWSCGLEKAE